MLRQRWCHTCGIPSRPPFDPSTGATSTKFESFARQPGMTHEYIHITQKGWEHLAGKTPQYDADIKTEDTAVCEGCATDELVESSW